MDGAERTAAPVSHAAGRASSRAMTSSVVRFVCATLSTPAYRPASCEDRCGIFPPRRPLWGGDSETPDPALRACDRVALPPDAAITGWAAAYLLGVTDLGGTAWTREGERALDISVVRTADRCRIRRPGR